MPYKLEKGLSPQPSIVEAADFWEIEVLRKKDGSASVTDIKKALQIDEDSQETESDDEEIKTEGFLDDISNEINRRIKACGENYPFEFNEKGYNLCLKENLPSEYKWLYIYLLLATRHNMGPPRIIDGIDGALLFETIGKDILKNYLGENSKGYVFGTENRCDDFHEKLNELVVNIGEGSLKNKVDLTYKPQDDKLDIAAWISFIDGQPSQIICFGQCKTGTSWHDQVEQLRSDSFVRKWLSDTPSLTPIDAFLIADIVDSRDFYHRSVNRLFFDRCRVMNFAKEIKESTWYQNMVDWSKGVLVKYKIPIFEDIAA